MPISREEVQHIATLARLQFSDEAEERLTEELEAILDYVETLDEVDTAGVPPMSHGLDHDATLRDDAAEPRIEREDALSRAPEADNEYVHVPTVIPSEES
jgi:aspartyl-tRNA(Asn)/glutamyl-tRNA(Gln) amidotransferase subunit C